MKTRYRIEKRFGRRPLVVLQVTKRTLITCGPFVEPSSYWTDATVEDLKEVYAAN